MRLLRPEFPPQIAEIIRQLPPDLKRSIKQSIRSLCADPTSGEPLKRKLDGLWRYRVRRFRIVYRADRSRRVLQVFAVGHRRTVYETLTRSDQSPLPVAASPSRRSEKAGARI